jgi:hypothetical protein
VQLSELALVATGQDGKAKPRLGVEIFVVEVKRRRVALALPLVLRKQREEAANGELKLGRGESRVPRGDLRSRTAWRSMRSSNQKGMRSLSDVCAACAGRSSGVED